MKGCENESDFQAKGYVQAQDGSWHKPARRNLGGLDQPQREPDPVPTLASRTPLRTRSKGSVVICVEIISFRKRLLDSDNLSSGATKNLRDAIARSLGKDDGDSCFRWHYSQQIAQGRTGTLVKITV